MNLPKLKAEEIDSRNRARAHKVIWQAGGTFGNVMMSRLETEQRRVLGKMRNKR
jgi:hypothetical protein